MQVVPTPTPTSPPVAVTVTYVTSTPLPGTTPLPTETPCAGCPTATAGTFPTAGPGSPTPQPVSNWLTPQVVTGTILVNNPYLRPGPDLTPITVAPLLVLMLCYCAVWPFVRDTVRIVLALVGIGAAGLVILSGSPQYVYGWALLALGLLVVELLMTLRPKRAVPK